MTSPVAPTLAHPRRLTQTYDRLGRGYTSSITLLLSTTSTGKLHFEPSNEIKTSGAATLPANLADFHRSHFISSITTTNRWVTTPFSHSSGVHASGHTLTSAIPLLFFLSFLPCLRRRPAGVQSGALPGGKRKKWSKPRGSTTFQSPLLAFLR